MNNKEKNFKNEELFNKAVYLMAIKYKPDIDTMYDVDTMYCGKYLTEVTSTINVTDNDIVVFNYKTSAFTLCHHVEGHFRAYIWAEDEYSDSKDVKMITLALSNPEQFNKMMKEQDELEEAINKLNNNKYLNLYTSAVIKQTQNTDGIMLHIIDDETPSYKHPYFIEHKMRIDSLRKIAGKSIDRW